MGDLKIGVLRVRKQLRNTLLRRFHILMSDHVVAGADDGRINQSYPRRAMGATNRGHPSSRSAGRAGGPVTHRRRRPSALQQKF